MQLFSKIGFPAAVVSTALALTFALSDPVENVRISALMADPVEFTDTVTYPVAGYKLHRRGSFDEQALPDSVLKALGIEIKFDSEDTVPKLTARDTIPVPDSLRLIDPFRYRFYVALLDSLTHRIVSDSLLASWKTLLEAGDTIPARADSADRFKLDSLYAVDSTARARAAFLAWYNSLDKAARKKYDYEQKVMRKMARMDSLKAIKEEKQAVRDSIRENEPRVLATFAVPDSMHYKRIITWTVDQNFHNISPRIPDTTYNHWFYDYRFRRNCVNATWLGVAGSPLVPYNYFDRKGSDMPDFYAVQEPWTYTPSTLPMYNTKTPYTELAYWGTLISADEKEEDNLHIFTTQNITPALNFSLLYERWGAGGMLVNETTKNKNFAFGSNYLGKRYLMHGGYIYNMVARGENGGLKDVADVRDTTIDAREMGVYLTNASSKIKKHTWFLDQQYRIPLTFLSKKEPVDTLGEEDGAAAADSLWIDRDVTTAFIGHSFQYSTLGRMYTDKIGTGETDARNFYNNVFNYNPTESADTMHVTEIDNKLFVRLQPWKDDALVSKLDVGLGDNIRTYFDSVATATRWREHSMYTYAGANGRLSRYVSWDASGRFFFEGYRAGDFSLDANASFNLYPFRRARNSPLSISAHFGTSLSEPDHYQQKIRSNHFNWDNNFSKISTTRLEGSVDIPYWKLSARAGYALLADNIYYDTLGVVRQNGTPMSVLSASVRKEFVFMDFLHMDNRVLFQASSNQEVLPLPALSFNARWFIQFVVQRDDARRKVLELQAGADVWYNTPWYSPAWNPNLGVFHNQQKVKYNNGPVIDLFINAQWKRACIFVKMENINMGWPADKADYFSAHHFIRTQNAIKVGMFWPFYMQPGKSSSGNKASSFEE